MAFMLFLAGALAVGTPQSSQDTEHKPPTLVFVQADEHVEVVGHDSSIIRGRIVDVTIDAIVLDTDSGRVHIPLSTIQQADRVGDSPLNGPALGAAIGGASTLALLAKICSNSNCADTSSNLDPRLTLLGTAIGAAVGALIDTAFDGRKTIYRAGAGQTLAAPARKESPVAVGARKPILFGRVGWARVTDDEGSLGHGATSRSSQIVRGRGRRLHGFEAPIRLFPHSPWVQVPRSSPVRRRSFAITRRVARWGLR
jgi:hypothetical protein